MQYFVEQFVVFYTMHVQKTSTFWVWLWLPWHFFSNSALYFLHHFLGVLHLHRSYSHEIKFNCNCNFLGLTQHSQFGSLSKVSMFRGWSHFIQRYSENLSLNPHLCPVKFLINVFTQHYITTDYNAIAIISFYGLNKARCWAIWPCKNCNKSQLNGLKVYAALWYIVSLHLQILNLKEMQHLPNTVSLVPSPK